MVKVVYSRCRERVILRLEGHTTPWELYKLQIIAIPSRVDISSTRSYETAQTYIIIHQLKLAGIIVDKCSQKIGSGVSLSRLCLGIPKLEGS